MEPAHTIIGRLGGEAAVATATGTAYTAPYRWQHPKDKGGTGGLIPQKHHPALLALARQRGIPLDASDFLPADPIAACPHCGAKRSDSQHCHDAMCPLREKAEAA